MRWALSVITGTVFSVSLWLFLAFDRPHVAVVIVWGIAWLLVQNWRRVTR